MIFKLSTEYLQQPQGYRMNSKGHRLSNQLLGLQTPKKTQTQTVVQLLPFDQIIELHRNVIKKLQDQIKYLRQYMKYCLEEKDSESQSETDSSIRKQNQNSQSKSPKTKKKSGVQQVLKQIMTLLGAEEIQHIVAKLTTVLEKANKKVEPVFVERIKYKEVPVPIEIVKQVVKYVEKEIVVEKRIQVPIFRQKIVYKYADKPAQTCTNQQKTNILDSVELDQKKKIPEMLKQSQSNCSQNSQTDKKTQQGEIKIKKFQKADMLLNMDLINMSNPADVVSPRNKQKEDFGKRKPVMQSPKYNQTFGYNLHGNMKSPRFRQKQREEDRNNDSKNGYEQPRDRQYRHDKNFKSPRYKAKGNFY